MNEILEILVNEAGAYDLGSIIKLFTIMIGVDGVIMTIYAIFRGFNAR